MPYRCLFWIRVLFPREQHLAKTQYESEDQKRLRKHTASQDSDCPGVNHLLGKQNKAFVAFFSLATRIEQSNPETTLPVDDYLTDLCKALSGEQTLPTLAVLGGEQVWPQLSILSTQTIYLANILEVKPLLSIVKPDKHVRRKVIFWMQF